MLGLGASVVGNKGLIVGKPNSTTNFTPASSEKIVKSNNGDFRVGSTDFSACFWIKLTADATGTSNLDGDIGLTAGACYRRCRP